MTAIGDIRKALQKPGDSFTPPVTRLETYDKALYRLEAEGYVIKRFNTPLGEGGTAIVYRYDAWDVEKAAKFQERKQQTRERDRQRKAASRTGRKPQPAGYPALGTVLRVTVVGEDGDGGYYINLVDEAGKSWTARL